MMTSDNITETQPIDVFVHGAPALSIDLAGFPDPPKPGATKLSSTLENFLHLLRCYGITVQFNQMKKRPEVFVPGLVSSVENRDAVTLTHLESLLIRHGMSAANASRYILAGADRYRFDPFAQWVDSVAWDGKSRLAEICETVVPDDDYPPHFAFKLIHKWLLSIVAATYHGSGFHSRGILTFQGKQGLGKTSWFGRLVTPLALREEAVKLGHSWDGGSKDARLSAIGHRIVELGELEGSFRKELESLKSFVTDRSDKIRPPYGRVASEYPRSTIFGASVNDSSFLIDRTGNSRFWTIAVKRLDYTHDVDMQQLFAELKVQFEAGRPWWLSSDEEETLAGLNQAHEVSSVIADRLAGQLDLERCGQANLPRLRALEVLEHIGFDRPTNAQLKEANSALRAVLGPHRRIRGANYWDVPWVKVGTAAPGETY
jgi:hypothetical protein